MGGSHCGTDADPRPPTYPGYAHRLHGVVVRVMPRQPRKLGATGAHRAGLFVVCVSCDTAAAHGLRLIITIWFSSIIMWSDCRTPLRRLEFQAPKVIVYHGHECRYALAGTCFVACGEQADQRTLTTAPMCVTSAATGPPFVHTVEQRCLPSPGSAHLGCPRTLVCHTSLYHAGDIV